MTENYDQSIGSIGEFICEKCGIPLIKSQVRFKYMNNAFPVELLMCPKCKFIYVPEELAMGKVLKVEKSLEDK
ncbi:hypothetical protein C8E03_102194 [Lachnotalea glycerini]|jgi:hypothetical protein|uniref:DUF7479 domain-containing protein n=1 Tax=Lachnotalea glycerini TaxID=1763509 RepID=A0A255P5N3_9FIRM|nr:CLJU_RS11820 family redox protein [Lachnotalea glycerini]OYP11529.1 hypothetical protein CG709_08690 [Lachnotalea glycerini]PXV93426.1 hypothetical protein C8E03_102194 [Lachnotalea glycerini]RDY31844.1 hypothetical protein CG710_007625 [Lachnotalea glycerini]